MSAIVEKAILRARSAFANNVPQNVDFRKTQLKALLRCLDENVDTLVNAVRRDFRKPSFETILTEIDYVKNDIKGQLFNIDDYVRPEPVSKNIVVMMDHAFIQREPYGVVLIIGAWNYPIQLVLCPLVGAIAAGNCAIVKPSELSPSTATTLSELLPKYLDNDCYHVITGGPEESRRLLEERFDYIFYTGSTTVGKIVNEAAAKHLTPVTLELGGKSPVYIDDSVPNMEVAWRRILWGKFINAGQTCVAPDYVLCTAKVQQTLSNFAEKIIREFFGDDPKKSPDLCRIVNDRHFERVSKLISSSGKSLIGGTVDRDENYVAPTILINVSPSDPIMREEIFGPVLPIMVVNSAQEAIDFVRKGEKPLSLYLFTTRGSVIQKFLSETSSGSVCANDTVIHLSIDSLPFGGVGSSGMGAYHGKYSFDTFSHPKSVLVRNYNPILEAIGSKRYPPYSDGNLWFMLNLLQKRQNWIPKYWSHYVMFLLGILAVMGYQSFTI